MQNPHCLLCLVHSQFGGHLFQPCKHYNPCKPDRDHDFSSLERSWPEESPHFLCLSVLLKVGVSVVGLLA